MENARENLVEQITTLIQKYTDECLKAKEKEKEKDEKEINSPISFELDVANISGSEDQYFTSFDRIKEFFNESKQHDNKIIELLKELRNGKYDDVFAYYNFRKDLSSAQNSKVSSSIDLSSFISDDYPLVKKREQRKDIEMISDPQMVLNFPKISSISDNLFPPSNVEKSNSPAQQEHSVEIPIRKLIVRKMKKGPSIKNVIYQNNSKNDTIKDSPKTNANKDISSSNQIDSLKSSTPSERNIINFTQDQTYLPKKKDENKEITSQKRFSQPNAPLKFLDLYPPDEPIVFPPSLNKLNKNQVKQNINLNSSDILKAKNQSPKRVSNNINKNSLPTSVQLSENQKDEDFMSLNSITKTIEPKINETVSTSNSPRRNMPNPFTSPPLDKSHSPFLSKSFKPIITSPLSNNLHFLTSTESSHDNSSSVHSSLQALSSDSSSQNHQAQSENESDEEEESDKDSIVENSSQIQYNDDKDQLNLIKPIVTGKDIQKSEAHFLSDGDFDMSQSGETFVNSVDEKTNQAEDNQSRDVNEKYNNFAEQNSSKDSQISNENLMKQEKNDSSSDFDESNLSQALQQSSFIFKDNNANSLGSMVRSSENPYTKLDAITRLPIKK